MDELTTLHTTWLLLFILIFGFVCYYVDVPEAVGITGEVNDGEITLRWEEPDNNVAAITQYDVYRRIVNDKTWTNIGTIKDTSKREFVVEGEKGKEYEFAVTATNKYGESSREDSIMRVEVPGGASRFTSTGKLCCYGHILQRCGSR